MAKASEIVLYHLYPSRSCRVLWLLKELGMKAKLVKIDFLSDKSATQNPELLAINPSGRLPAMRDGDVCISQSGACVMYILEKYAGGKLQPALSDYKGRAAFLKHVFAAEDDIMEPATKIFWHAGQLPEDQRLPQVVDNSKKKLTEFLKLLEKDLEGKKYLVNDEFSAADIMMGESLLICTMLGAVDDKKHKNIISYFDGLKQRPAYKETFQPDST